MPLEFNGAWRFKPPPDGKFRNERIPDAAVEEFRELIVKTATQGETYSERQQIVEHFKGHFCEAVGSLHVWSTSYDWALADLRDCMKKGAENAPVFLEAFFDACESLHRTSPKYAMPTVDIINNVCRKHEIGYQIRPPHLVLQESISLLVTVPECPPTLAERAREMYQASLQRSEELLHEGRGREAVQELLWLLETVSTAFTDLETECGRVEGKYFNEIVRELRRLYSGTTLAQVTHWVTALHGYLSSPTGGGIRHGLDLREGIAINLNEAYLFCNLIRSYLSFLVAEYERLLGDSRR